jgi:hypothetical protein
MRKTDLGLFIALVMTVFMCGCTIIHSEPTHLPPFENNDYVPHVTHYSKVLKDFGPPTKISKLSGGMVWLYEGIDLTEHQVGLNLEGNNFSILKFSFSLGEGEYTGQFYVFDNKGYLLSTGESMNDVGKGSGSALQFIFTYTSLVDMSDMRDQALQHDWGQSLLTSVPEGLNNNQNMNSGKNGLHLLTTPVHTGQHTLSAP